jgi:hypothetical protein
MKNYLQDKHQRRSIDNALIVLNRQGSTKKRLAVHDLIKNLNLNTPYNAGFAERIIEIKSIKN